MLNITTTLLLKKSACGFSLISYPNLKLLLYHCRIFFYFLSSFYFCSFYVSCNIFVGIHITFQLRYFDKYYNYVLKSILYHRFIFKKYFLFLDSAFIHQLFMTQDYKYKENHQHSTNEIMEFSMRTYSCHMCSKVFNRKDNFNRHLRSHAGEKRYKCDKCSRVYSSNQSLKCHIIQHHKK